MLLLSEQPIVLNRGQTLISKGEDIVRIFKEEIKGGISEDKVLGFLDIITHSYLIHVPRPFVDFNAAL